MISHWCLYYNKYLNPLKEIFSARLCNILYLLSLGSKSTSEKYSGFKGSNIDELSFTMRNV